MDYSGKIITKNPVEPSQTSAPGVWTLDQATQAVQGNNWPIAYVPNPISRSLRFNSADQPSLRRTPSTTTNRRTFTYSWWFKIGKQDGQERYFLTITDSNSDAILLESGYKLRVGFFANTYRLSTTQVFRDPGAWYHGVVTVDTTDGTSSNRVKLYINGERITSFSTETYPTQNYDTKYNVSGNECYIGANGNPGDAIRAWDGYLTEVNFIDGQALDPTYFGMTDPRTGAWIPKKYSGTYGTNGFYLNFSDNSSTAALGTDYSGNSNTWTTNNFSVTAGSGNDSMTDVPTPWFPYNTTGDIGGVVRGNYATLNPLAAPTGFSITASNGNLDVVFANATYAKSIGSTFGLSSGKWYFEATTNTGATVSFVGIEPVNSVIFSDTVSSSRVMGYSSTGYSYFSSGDKRNNNTDSAYGTSYTTNDVIGVAVDMDSGKIWFSKNGTWQASGNPAAGTNAAFTSIPANTYIPGVSAYNSQGWTLNFGQRPFAYTPPAGFKSLCTTNLSEPTILDGGDYFNAVLYTGNGSTQSITGVGFQPDFTWLKDRSNVRNHYLYDVVRGPLKELYSNLTSAESSNTIGLSAFDSDGFTINSGDNAFNGTGNSYVAWNWKESATSGFDIVTYTGDGNSNRTVNHNLGVAPSMIIVKRRSDASTWAVYHSALGAGKKLELNGTSGAITNSQFFPTTPTSTVFYLGTEYDVNGNAGAFVSYLFAAVPGFSAFGSYTGNGSADGPFVYTGFRPRFLLLKRTDSADNWYMYDTVRDSFNVVDRHLHPNLSNAEGTGLAFLDILSNGFKLKQSYTALNASGGTYIYAAFAENPFKYSTAR